MLGAIVVFGEIGKPIVFVSMERKAVVTRTVPMQAITTGQHVKNPRPQSDTDGVSFEFIGRTNKRLKSP